MCSGTIRQVVNKPTAGMCHIIPLCHIVTLTILQLTYLCHDYAAVTHIGKTESNLAAGWLLCGNISSTDGVTLLVWKRLDNINLCFSSGDNNSSITIHRSAIKGKKMKIWETRGHTVVSHNFYLCHQKHNFCKNTFQAIWPTPYQLKQEQGRW